MSESPMIGMECSWVTDGSLAKLLGAPFGVSLDTQDIDEFLPTKDQQKKLN